MPPSPPPSPPLVLVELVAVVEEEERHLKAVADGVAVARLAPLAAVARVALSSGPVQVDSSNTLCSLQHLVLFLP